MRGEVKRKTDDRIRKAERKEGDFSRENIMAREDERNTCIIREQGCQQISLQFSLWLSCAGCDIPYSIILQGKARLSLLISVSGAKTLSSWFSFEDPIYSVPLTPHRELSQHTVG